MLVKSVVAVISVVLVLVTLTCPSLAAEKEAGLIRFPRRHLPSEDTHVLRPRAVTSEIDWAKVFSIWNPDRSVKFSWVIIATQVIVAAGWVVMGIFYAIAAPNNQELTAFDFLFGPQAVATNTFRRMVLLILLCSGLFLKTLLTLGMHDAMEKYMKPTWADVESHLTGESFLRNIIGRGIMAGIFQVVGWTLIGLVAGSNIFAFKGKKKRRRKRTIKAKSEDFELRARMAFHRLVTAAALENGRFENHGL